MNTFHVNHPTEEVSVSRSNIRDVVLFHQHLHPSILNELPGDVLSPRQKDSGA